MINSILDNDLYKVTMQNAVCQMYPDAKVHYTFFDRGATYFPNGFDSKLQDSICALANVRLTREEKAWLRRACPFLSPVYLDFLFGYQFDPTEIVKCRTSEGCLELEIEGPWFRTILWEVPLMAMISELYWQTIGAKPTQDWTFRARKKATALESMAVKFADFGTRRRFSREVHSGVVEILKQFAPTSFVGSSNMALAMANGTRPIGTQAHEWFMFHGAKYGYREANHLGLKRWTDVYHGDLGIALSDTFTSEVFFRAFDMKYAKLFDGVRHDSGDPVEFAAKAIAHYESLGIDPRSKTVVFSDGLNVAEVERIHAFCKGKIRASYGIGTNLTNDVGVKPLNIVIKMTAAECNGRFIPTVKLSDNPGKHTGDSEEVVLCRKMLGIA